MEVLNGLKWGSKDKAPDDAPDEIPDTIEELDDALPPDPKPGRRQPRSKSPAAKVTAADRRTIEDALNLIQLSIGGGLAFRDPHCGGAILEHHENISKKAVPIIARNPAWVAWFCGSAGWLDAFALIMAVKPVLGAFWSHHVTHSIAGGEDGGAADFAGFQAPDLV